jgi:hypothetical protein
LDKAWKIMLDYKAWNPDFANSRVTLVSGQAGGEDEVVLIQPLDANGVPIMEFYAATVKVVPRRHIVWYVYPKEGTAFRNFVDFGLSETSSGVTFNIAYYAQSPLSGEALLAERQNSEASLGNLATAFKQYCESHA